MRAATGKNQETHTAPGSGKALLSSQTFFPLPDLRTLRECDQVAAVCFRIGGGGIEFLLVKTGGGRWTFPKGGIEPGLTHAQAAALEAFEEAGVHGRMEENCFARYSARKRGESRRARRIVVNAYLCEVSRLGPPKEAGRNRTWLSPARAKQRLLAYRSPRDGEELAALVDRAVGRIQRLQRANVSLPEVMPRRFTDGLRKVQFDACETVAVRQWMVESSQVRGARPGDGREPRLTSVIEEAVRDHVCKVVTLRAPARGLHGLLPGGTAKP